MLQPSSHKIFLSWGKTNSIKASGTPGPNSAWTYNRSILLLMWTLQLYNAVTLNVPLGSQLTGVITLPEGFVT